MSPARQFAAGMPVVADAKVWPATRLSCCPWQPPCPVVVQVTAFGGDRRAGIDRTLHRISAIINRDGDVVGLTCRVGRTIPGEALPALL